MKKTIYQTLTGMSTEERAEFVESQAIGVMYLDRVGVRVAARLTALCPKKLSKKVLGAPADCEGLNRPGGSCAACTERFLRMEWPERADKVLDRPHNVQFMKRFTEVR